MNKNNGRKKPGRKSLGLTVEEMKAHRERLRVARRDGRRRQEKINAIMRLALLIPDSQTATFEELEKAANAIADDPRWTIKYNPDATLISGVEGGRVRRHD